ncbi:MAG: pseudouridine synthase [Bacteroidia bacterium]
MSSVGLFRYFAIYKPYGYLSQFTDPSGKHKTLGMLHDFPKDAYPVGRLDKDSEGLLIITNDKDLNHRLLKPAHEHEREYWVVVENIPDEQALKKMEQGLTLRIEQKILETRPARAKLMDAPPGVPERHPPVRYRTQIPTAWLSLTLTEGKNRQVRRMTAAVGHPTLRLLRYRIEGITLPAMEIGAVREMERQEVYKKLFGKQGL